MKIKNRLNSDSIKSIKEFNQKQIQSNIKLHKISLLIIIIINLVLIIFIILYKSKIYSIKLNSNINSSKLSEKKNFISTINNSISHKLVNILAISMSSFGNFHFSLIFDNSEEVNLVKKIISYYKIKKEPNLLLIYQGYVDTDESPIILDIIKYYSNTLTIIKTKNEEKFGFFFDNAIIPNKQGFFESNSHKCFIFSFSDKINYDCKINNQNFNVNKDILFNIGNGDIEINHNFHTYGGKINFPFKSFNIPENKDSLFKRINGYIDIQDIEIYVVINENYDYYDLRKIIFM